VSSSVLLVPSSTLNFVKTIGWSWSVVCVVEGKGNRRCSVSVVEAIQLQLLVPKPNSFSVGSS